MTNFYLKRPVVIEARQFTGTVTSRQAILARLPGLVTMALLQDGGEVRHWVIDTLEGRHEVSIGDFVIKDVEGEFYVCKPDIFKLTYKPASNHQD